MSAATLGQDGLAALDDRDYPTAIASLTSAISASPSPKWLVARSRALVATSRFPEALSDAEAAYHLALDRGSRDLILDAQYRRAVALHRLGQHADADACLAWVMAACGGGRLADAEKAVPGGDAAGVYAITRADVEEMLREKREGESAGSPLEKMNVKETPGGRIYKTAGTLRLSVLHAMEASPADAQGRKRSVPIVPPKGDGPPKLAETKPAASAAPKQLRVDAYESDVAQTISVFTKKVDKEAFKLEWLSDSKILIGPLPEAPSGSAVIELGGDADRAQVSVTVRPMKVELRVGKKGGGKWDTPKCYTSTDQPSGSPAAAAPTTSSSTTAPPSSTAPTAPAAAPATTKPEAAKPAPAYPTSSRSGPKNWDNIADADDDEDEGSADPNAFFKKLYAGASDEQKRAMMKSFTESSGTALSTDWGDVKDRRVETKPPEGVEAKEWE